MALQFPRFIRAVFSPQDAEPVFKDSNGAIYAPSSFGVADTTFKPEWSPAAVFQSQRRRELEFRRQFFECTTHDAKTFDMDGCPVGPGPQLTQPFVGGSLPAQYIPLASRRPSVPYRLAKKIVRSFTSKIFGHDHFPAITCLGDPETEDWLRGFAEATGLRTLAVRARNMGGSCGTVALSWSIYEGVPRVQVHAGSALEVVEWRNREELLPAHVVELTRYPEDKWDPKKQRFERKWLVQRRDWTPLADLYFLDRLDDDKSESPWVLDRTRTVEHGDGEPHIHWVQNDPSDGIDGQPDYADEYEALNSLDLSSSVAHRGTVLNLDPTLVLACDPDIVKRGGVVKKGSDNSLTVGEGGSAEYLELSGSSVAAGKELIARERAQIMECCGCVAPDPEVVAAAGTSSLGIRLVYEPMLDVVDVRREQYGRALVQLLEQVTASVRKRQGGEGVEVYEVQPDGSEALVQYEALELPPKVEDELDADGKPTGKTLLVPRRLGPGGPIQLKWGADFALTPSDQKTRTDALSAAAGGKPVISHQSAVEAAAPVLELDPREEWRRVSLEADDERARQAAQDASVLGTADVADPDALDSDESVEQTQQLELASTDLAKIITVNEARASVGLAPIEGGNITVAEFFARQQAKAEVQGEAQGQAVADAILPKPPEPAPAPDPPATGAPGGAAAPPAPPAPQVG